VRRKRGGPTGPLQGGRLRRRRPWTGRLAAAAAIVALGAAAWLAFPRSSDDPARVAAPRLPAAEAGASAGDRRSAPAREQRRARRERARLRRHLLAQAPARTAVRHEFGTAPRAGLLFDVDSGEVLWQRHPRRELAIASLTKMMSALLIDERHDPAERVRISAAAAATDGSKLGVLPVGKRVRLGALLKGLLLVSGNDAAVALAEHDAGRVGRFVKRMNHRAREMGLRCTRFSSPHGLQNGGNRSCARDLAAMARAMLASPRLRAIVGADRARFEFPVEGGRLDLFNNNPFIRAGDRTITGVKTGYTEVAGRCYVTTAERGGRHLGVVLLDSPNPLAQVPKLLELGAEA
jgi:serine-type D-Ala-D-Ala carboxypeptidase (penicillin-binding protein 5/6)